MCGFVGGLYYEETAVSDARLELFSKANELIFHRGPDDCGYFHDHYVSMAFRRLSIIDKENGHQPYSYDNGRYIISFNGEIYNHIELRETLRGWGIECETSSDTEVLVALYAAIGKDVLYRIRGMFSFLIWDTEENLLFGARDHFGIKPFYYADRQDGIFFASEKKSLIPFIDSIQLDKSSLQQYLAFQYVPEPLTMDTIIRKVPPGSYFIKKENDEKCTFTSYWKPEFQPSATYNEEHELKNIREALTESVEKHMRSDVPVGAFLSGGIDSTIIASLASKIHPSINTFTVGFEYEKYSEVDVAEKTAEALGTNHTTYLVQPEEFIQELPKVIWHMDDPVADPASIPLYFIAREASKQVTVVLSGEGADELFAGYNIYKEPNDLAMFQSIPKWVKNFLLFSSGIFPEGMKGKSFIHRGCTNLSDRYIGNAHIFKEQDLVNLLAFPYDSSFKRTTDPIYQQTQNLDDISKMQTIDINTWLRGDILTKADRMTMAHSLELRVPFLDKEVFKAAAHIPASSKIQNGETKSMLRRAFKDVIPHHVVHRKKLGFPVPIRIWLKNELYDWTTSLIKDSPTDYLLNKGYLKQVLDEHALGKHDNSRKLWTVITFMLWHKQFVEEPTLRIDQTNKASTNKSFQIHI